MSPCLAAVQLLAPLLAGTARSVQAPGVNMQESRCDDGSEDEAKLRQMYSNMFLDIVHCVHTFDISCTHSEIHIHSFHFMSCFWTSRSKLHLSPLDDFYLCINQCGLSWVSVYVLLGNCVFSKCPGQTIISLNLKPKLLLLWWDIESKHAHMIKSMCKCIHVPKVGNTANTGSYEDSCSGSTQHVYLTDFLKSIASTFTRI